MRKIFDSHAHLNLCGDETEYILKEFKDSGGYRIILPATTFYSNYIMANMCSNDAGHLLSMAAGLHPKHVPTPKTTDYESTGVFGASKAGINRNINAEKDALEKLTDQIDKIEELARGNDKVVAIKTGLNIQEFTTNKQLVWQTVSFKMLVTLSRKLKLPLVLHLRGALGPAYDILTTLFKDDYRYRGVVHCYTGADQSTVEYACKYMDLGFALGIGGALTWKEKNPFLGRIVSEMPQEKILLETDSPYVIPKGGEPRADRSGKVWGAGNTPCNLPAIAQEIAMLRDVSIREVYEVTAENGDRIFPMK